MQSEIAVRLIERELNTLREEIELYPDDRTLCQELPGLRNPGGNLALHLCGNLQHFVGGILGGSGYVRQREAEFARRDLTRAELLAEIEKTRAVVGRTLRALPADRWASDFPAELQGKFLPTPLFLAHLCVHLSYHLGQLNVHRRAVTADVRTPASISIIALSEGI